MNTVPLSHRSLAFDADALDFAPDLLVIQERPPARGARMLTWTLGLLVAMLLVWASIARLDIITTAEGRLVPLTYTKVVQPADAGVVADILVKDGDSVEQGQLLLTLDPRLAQADASALDQDVSLRRLTLRRIEAELADRPMRAEPSDPPALYAQVEAQSRARRLAHQDAVAREQEVLNKARADLVAAQQVQSKLAQTLPSYQQSAESYRQLQKEGFVGELAANDKTREATERAQDLRAQSAMVQSLEASIAQSQRQLASLSSQYRSQLENERIEVIAQLNRSGQELQKANVRAGYLEIRAPNAGVVKDLATTTRGAVVAAGTVLMNIVPRDEPLQAELRLRNEDVGFVAVGQPARVKVAAYPFQKHGMLDGEVMLVGADAAEGRASAGAAVGSPAAPADGSAATSALTYRAVVKLSGTTLDNAGTGERLPLSAGMGVTAEVHQGSRTVLEYLLSPVQRAGQEAARER
jgi:HlyD family secretion protein